MRIPRRALDPDVVDLVLRLAREDPRWGYLRIVAHSPPDGAFSDAGAAHVL